ncbi:MAG: hypothetical protein ACTSR2_02615 [Candidatus Hodarchaeales archaeon]
MGSPFCEKCGTVLTPKKNYKDNNTILWCSKCKREVVRNNSDLFQEHTQITHESKEMTRILENEPPPIPKIFTQSYDQRKKKRCKHPNAVFQGFYQFSRGDEASRKYWYCPNCGQVFRFSGKVNVKPKRKLIAEDEP